ncbi:hypothetical protein M514_10975 [Trichuris suis]|uniref:Uncharacterized protein n=1 Tax=Trichuris suis TaxID=68888 RepID=A0A085MWZ7_9BILA|nr:hypothetical protein M513_10975 [Trichuris suis]KFD61743.1 hypothetical protein M514_10975 [Trichuris suis]
MKIVQVNSFDKTLPPPVATRCAQSAEDQRQLLVSSTGLAAAYALYLGSNETSVCPIWPINGKSKRTLNQCVQNSIVGKKGGQQKRPLDASSGDATTGDDLSVCACRKEGDDLRDHFANHCLV